MQNKTKRQHYIPQFYLRNFSIDKENLWVFDRVTNKWRFQKIQNIAYENKIYFYQVEGSEESLEDIFTLIENLAKPIIDKLLEKKEINGWEKADLAMFVASLSTRIPVSRRKTEKFAESEYKNFARKTFSDPDKVRAMAKKGNLDKKEINGLVEFATDGSRYFVKFPSNVWLYTMLMSSLEFARLFINMNWTVVYFKKENALITSDNPLILLGPKNRSSDSYYGLVTPGSHKIVPLASNVCLVIEDLNRVPRIDYVESLNKDSFRSTNDLIAFDSDRFIFSAVRGKLERIMKNTKIDKYKSLI